MYSVLLTTGSVAVIFECLLVNVLRKSHVFPPLVHRTVEVRQHGFGYYRGAHAGCRGTQAGLELGVPGFGPTVGRFETTVGLFKKRETKNKVKFILVIFSIMNHLCFVDFRHSLFFYFSNIYCRMVDKPFTIANANLGCICC